MDMLDAIIKSWQHKVDEMGKKKAIAKSEIRMMEKEREFEERV